MEISAKYSSFDLNSRVAAYRIPNLDLSFSEDVKTVRVIAEDKDGNYSAMEFTLDERGKGWHMAEMPVEYEEKDDKTSRREEDFEIACDYFNGCFETDGYDEGLIKRMSEKRNRTVAEIKAIIAQYRDEVAGRNEDVRKIGIDYYSFAKEENGALDEDYINLMAVFLKTDAAHIKNAIAEFKIQFPDEYKEVVSRNTPKKNKGKRGEER